MFGWVIHSTEIVSRQDAGIGPTLFTISLIAVFVLIVLARGTLLDMILDYVANDRRYDTFSLNTTSSSIGKQYYRVVTRQCM